MVCGCFVCVYNNDTIVLSIIGHRNCVIEKNKMADHINLRTKM